MYNLLFSLKIHLDFAGNSVISPSSKLYVNTKTEDLYADYSDEDLMIGGATIKLRPISQNRNVSYLYTSSKTSFG